MDQSPNPISPTLIVEDVEKQRRIVWNTHDQSHFGVALCQENTTGLEFFLEIR